MVSTVSHTLLTNKMCRSSCPPVVVVFFIFPRAICHSDDKISGVSVDL